MTRGHMHAALTLVIGGSVFRTDTCFCISILNLTIRNWDRGSKVHHVVYYFAIVLPGGNPLWRGKRLCKKRNVDFLPENSYICVRGWGRERLCKIVDFFPGKK